MTRRRRPLQRNGADSGHPQCFAPNFRLQNMVNYDLCENDVPKLAHAIHVLHFFWLVHHPWSPPAIPAMLPCMTLTRLSFHNLESDSPTSSTTERETIVHRVILSVCAPSSLCTLQLSCVHSYGKNIPSGKLT